MIDSPTHATLKSPSVRRLAARRETFTILKCFFTEYWQPQGLIDKSNPLNHFEEIISQEHFSIKKKKKLWIVSGVKDEIIVTYKH